MLKREFTSPITQTDSIMSHCVLFTVCALLSGCSRTNCSALHVIYSVLTLAVRYLGSLEAFVSCSTRPQSSMVIGWREKESTSQRITSYSTEGGVWDVDYHLGLGLLGGGK